MPSRMSCVDSLAKRLAKATSVVVTVNVWVSVWLSISEVARSLVSRLKWALALMGPSSTASAVTPY